MKKLFILLLAAGTTFATKAQRADTGANTNWDAYSNRILLSEIYKHNIDSAKAFADKHRDMRLSRWVLDINLLGGLCTQDYKTANSTGNYLNALNANTGNQKFTNGMAYGADAQLGFFFGKKRHFGFGTGFMYLMQQGDASLDNFHIEYQAKDYNGSTFRQVVTGSNLKENLTMTNMNIPLMLKYKDRFSKRWGFTADAGVLLNMGMTNETKTNASFDYEAIYQFRQNADGGKTPIYDNSPIPASNDWLITKAQFIRNNSNGNVNDYFNAKRALGYNVGLNETPTNNKSTVSYNTMSVGLMLQPSINYFLSNNVALNLGAYYLYQPFKNTPQSNYRLTDATGNYSSVLNNTSAITNQSYGINFGARFFLGNKKDKDYDEVANKKDKCPDVFGLKKFNGCPDTDGDGIMDSEDSCVLVPGLAKFHGCPDTDGDGIPDNKDRCPLIPGTIKNHGCPDTLVTTIVEDTFPGTKVAPYKEPAVKTVVETTNDEYEIATPVLFDVNMTTIHQEAYSEIDAAADTMKENKHLTMIIDGNADSTGVESFNKTLSIERANAVKAELVKKGINPNRIITRGHGSRIPVATNRTYEGKQENRNATMRLVRGKRK